jgi:fluoride exporter
MSGFMLVALGGGAGVLARYALARTVPAYRGLPLAILIANVFGSLGLGVILGAGSDIAFLLLGVGFCGGLTTVSTWAMDTIVLGKSGFTAPAIYNVVLTVAGSLAAVALGIWVGASLG